MKQLYLLFLAFTFLLLLAFSPLQCQEVSFFSDSNNPGYYDTGLAFKSGNSFLEQTGSSGDKIPTDATAFQGRNSLRLRWISRSGGDWSALVIAPGFPFLDISNTDTLAFWAYAPNGLNKSDWPNLFLEGAPGATKSRKYNLATFAPGLEAKVWTQIKMPLSIFFNDPNQTGINFKQIKAIIFGQNGADAQEHTLLIDEVRTFKASSTSTLLAPELFRVKGYDSHIELNWKNTGNSGGTAFRVYRSLDEGKTFSLIGQAGKNDSTYLDFVRPLGLNVKASYRITTATGSGQESQPSAIASTASFPMSDDQLLDMVQSYTFRYFWDFAHPSSGLIRERNTSGDIVTIGGTGFGVMALLVGIKRGFITRDQGRERLLKMIVFLEKADRFKGVFPHWMNGVTGKTIPFSTRDDGGDLVETSFLFEGLLTAREYFSGRGTIEEKQLRDKITGLWEAIEWDWYRQYYQNFLFWHWSPNYQFAMNFPVRGWNEGMMVYLLGIASPTHGVPEGLYEKGWAGNSNYVNKNQYYSVLLPLGPVLGGPLFFAHYSFMGFDPRNIIDRYTNYFRQNRNHTLINRAYCIANPKGFKGYGENCWGLTASDDPIQGYLAHEPNSGPQDNGTIAPTAALGSFPYTPTESLAALKHFYRQYGAELWGPMGFYDAFNPQLNWYADSYLAIDQGPIINMIENQRSGLLWQHFMYNPEILTALSKMGFSRDVSSVRTLNPTALKINIHPNPVRNNINLDFIQPASENVTIDLSDSAGRVVHRLLRPTRLSPGLQNKQFSLPVLPGGTYFLQISSPTYKTAYPLVISQ
ncbi:glucoamylase family protein [Haliscomenobacter sp.]|uniref:glucoamylase family protein n=1 Tax=Haliscomenobacter sp. TaxID=2717303 RepID=UPI003364B521